MNANNQSGYGQRQSGYTPNQSGFTPRTKGGKKRRRVNKDGVLTLLFIALIAIIVIVLIVFLVKAIASSGEPSKTTEPSQTASTPAQTTATDPSQTTSTETTSPTPTTEAPVVQGYTPITLTPSQVLRGPLVLINETNQYTMPTGDDNTLTSLYNQPGFKTSYRLKNSHVALRYEIIEKFAAMIDMLKARFASTSLAEDSLLITNAGTVNDPNAVLDYSDENVSGYSFDIRVYITSTGKNRRLNADEQAWLADNCARYGFVLRYEEGKESTTGVLADLYHFRYVGIPHSTYMKANDLCLEEYISLIKNYTYKSPLTITNGAKRYDVYYVKLAGPETTAYVPSGAIYEISGNNVDGFIVTVEK